jgi:RNA polymerase sigma-70 factor (ECF subfamily)
VDELDDITLEKAKTGNAVAFRCLYAHYSPFVWRLCYRASNGDVPRAEEILQNTFIKVHRYLGSFTRHALFSTWLYRITYHCINEYYSKAAKQTEREVALNEEHAYDEQRLPYETRQLVAKILKPLTETERFLLTAREVDGIPYEDLADIMGVAEGTLRTRVTRLKAEIKERINKRKDQ